MDFQPLFSGYGLIFRLEKTLHIISSLQGKAVIVVDIGEESIKF